MQSGLNQPDPLLTEKGLAVLCDRQGVLIKVMRDDLMVLAETTLPISLAELVDFGSRNKALRFIDNIVKHGATIGWEINLPVQGKLTLLLLGGVLQGDQIVLIAAESTEQLAQLYHYFFGPDQVPSAQFQSPVQKTDQQRFAQMAALNSQLTNVQRQLAQKNMQLQTRNRQLRLMQRTISRQRRALLQANRKLSDAATRDPLTGLRNRRAMTHRLDYLLRQASAQYHPLSILMVDIDHFKRINDCFGHPVGDRVLQQVAEILSTGARHGDLVVRYGGEEFLLILPDCQAESSITLAHRLLLAVQNHAFDHDKVTISIGVATSTPHLLNKDRLIQQADAALYHGKQNGRNRVIHFNDLPPQMNLPIAA